MADKKSERKKRIEQEYVYALEAMMGDAVDHEREEKARALQEAEEQSAKKLKAKSRMMKLVAVGAVAVVLMISGALWMWFEGRPAPTVPVEDITAELRDVIKDEIASATQPKWWRDLDEREQQLLRAQAFLLFPQILKHEVNWQEITQWMLDAHNVQHYRVRDIFRSAYSKDYPNIYARLEKDLDVVYSEMKRLDSSAFKKYWGREVPQDFQGRTEIWFELIRPYAVEKVGKEKAEDFIGYLQSHT